jgi:uncharacterized protein (TIGR02271 family)
MNREAPPIVFDDEGTVGFLDPGVRPREGSSDPVAMILDDGRNIHVPADCLAAEPDGRYRLLVGRADLEDLSVEEATHDEVIPIVAEEVEVGKRKVERGKVRVRKGVTMREETVDVPLIREEVEVVRVPVNRPLEGPAEVRREGDVLIVPVVEEVLVVEKRLILKEELRITTRRVEERAPRRVTLRTEKATVERDGQDEVAAGAGVSQERSIQT